MLLTVVCSLFATAFGNLQPSVSSVLLEPFANAFSLAPFVTYEDKAAFVGTFLYVLYYCARMELQSRSRGGSSGGGARVPRPVNPVLASISLAVQRIYSSLDNPYTPTISFLMLTWTLHKISMLERSMEVAAARLVARSNPSPTQEGSGALRGGGGVGGVPLRWAGIVDILLDCVLVSCFLYTGMVIQVGPFLCVGGQCMGMFA